MKNKKSNVNIIRKRYFLLINIIVLVDIIFMILWYYFNIKPIFAFNNEIKTIVQTQELKKEYKTEKEFYRELERISKKYNIKFKLVTENNKIKKNPVIKNKDYFLFNDTIIIKSDSYFLTAYIHRKYSITVMAIFLILFQIFITFIVMGILYLTTGKTIINPIQRLIENIRDYKFGIKPEPNKVKTELDIIQNEFVNLVESLEEEKKEQNRIIASISHDIKTPLTSIMGYSSLLDDEDLKPEEIQEYSKKINQKAKDIKEILETFDDYLVNYNNKKLNLTNIKVKDIVNDLLADYKIELESKKIFFEVNCKCNNKIVNIDILKIKRVFSNIISNSMRYVPKENARIIVDITSDKENIIFKIKDNGIGVKEENLNKIFDPFVTSDPSRKISGLGLSICKEFIEMHGGKIKAYNDNGLCIYFEIPYINKKKE